MHKHHLLLILAAIFAFALSHGAAAQGIQMLPPIQSGTANTVCPVSALGQILSWDGANPIHCQTGVVVDNAGNVGIGNASPQSKLDVSGGVKIGMDAALCTGTKAGTLRYNSGRIEYCDGAMWKNAFVGTGPAWVSPEFYEDTEGTYVGANCPDGTVMTGIWTINIGMGGHNNWYIICK